jgi:CubicO group peptidase (beta-lactamase class C family)
LPYKNVTISQVLSQSSGIPNALLGNFYIHWLSEHKDYNRDLSLNKALENNTDLVFKPGEEIGYSNLGYAILGKVIENVSGLKYEEYIKKNIFDRLKLNNEKINFNSQRQKNAALPYFRRYSLINNFLVLFLKGSTTQEEGVWKSINRPFYFNHPSHGGIVASASEYAKIFMSLMRDDNSVLLSSDWIKKMFSKQVSYKDKNMAISWFMGEMNNVPYYFHQGSGIGYIAEVRIYPKEKFGSILLMNRTEYNALTKLNILDSEIISSIHNNDVVLH